MPRAFIAVILGIGIAFFAAGCATLNARKAFSQGEKARANGDYDEAIKRYQEALTADPKKPEYRSALESAKKEAVRARADAAKDAEARGDDAAAAALWDEALARDPDSRELLARRDLARLRTKRSDPVEYFEAAKKLAEALPTDEAAQRTLAEAKHAAFSFHLRLAETYLDARAWAQAGTEFEVAKKIDPASDVFQGTRYRKLRAKELESLGDEKMRVNDALAAYQAYEEAASYSKDPELQAKMSRARRGAGSLLEQLEQARGFEALKKWEDAAEIYSFVAGRPGAPKDTVEHAKKCRAESAKIRAARAQAFAERRSISKAMAELRLALEHTDAPKDAERLISSAIDDLIARRPGDAKAKLDRARELAPNLAVLQAASPILSAVADNAYDEARAEAGSHPADALLALRRLQPFEDSLKGYAQLKASLTKRAFGALVEQAEQRAAEGNYGRAAELLLTALEISKPPPDVADDLKNGTRLLEKRDYEGARDAFGRVLSVSPKSNLARVGRKVASSARLKELKNNAEDARAAEDPMRAATAYRAILAIEPSDPDAQAGLDRLKGDLLKAALTAAKEYQARGRAGAAFLYYKRALDLDRSNEDAKAGLAALQSSLETPEEPAGFVAQVARGEGLGPACPGFETALRERLILYLNKTRKLGADFLRREDTVLVDQNKRPAPLIALRARLESCTIDGAGGSAAAGMEIALADAVIAKDRVVINFDPGPVPKDEVQEKLDPARVEKTLVADGARQIAQALKAHAGELADWRAKEAEAEMKANDAEGAARAYAALVSAKSPSESERRAIRDLEQFLMNRFR